MNFIHGLALKRQANLHSSCSQPTWAALQPHRGFSKVIHPPGKHDKSGVWLRTIDAGQKKQDRID
jgi:hypothetical protein